MQFSVLVWISTLLQLAQADLPVHCLLQDVAGEWEFSVGPPQAPREGLVGEIPQCGHHIPNQVVSMLSADPAKEVPEATTEKFRVTLTEEIQTDPIRHLHVTGGVKADSKAAGNLAAGGYWTMVFDEGFEVRSHEGRSFFAHFDFEVLPNATKTPSHGDRWDDIAKYYGRIPQIPGQISGQSKMLPKGELYACHCDRLSVGWWHQHNKEGKLESGCFWAEKVKKEVKSEASSFLRWSKKDGKNTVEPVANGKLRGASKAAVVSLHVTDASDLGRILDISEIPSNMDRGASSNKEVLLPASRELKDDLDRVAKPTKSFVDLGTAPATLNASAVLGDSLPESWDWRHVVQDMSPNGVDDLSEQFSQGNCGSCYAFSGSQVLAMRFRIRLFQKHKILYPLELSWRSATQCSPYTEGCEGGFAYLTFKYAAEMGLPLASCDKQVAPDTLDQTCNWNCYRDNKDIFYAKDYGQTGGFAHGSNEDSIMREIHANGPVIVSFATSAVPEFIYNNGQSMREETDVLTVFKNELTPREKSSSNSKILPWSYTTHSILAVGWGQETDAHGEVQKYWIVRNSWGKDWGTQGYAKIRRGNNDAAIETSAPWVEPDMDRLPEGFLKMAQQYHDEQEETRAKAKGEVAPEAKATGKAGKPAYCKLRPDSPDCQ